VSNHAGSRRKKRLIAPRVPMRSRSQSAKKLDADGHDTLSSQRCATLLR